MTNTVAVLIPCLNEAGTIARVVAAAKRSLPQAQVAVCDNASTDDTPAQARRAGAVVFYEPCLGKGNAVRRLLQNVQADVYVLVDGDATYDLSCLQEWIDRFVSQKLDFFNIARRSAGANCYRPGHLLGNKLLGAMVRCFFGRQIKDVFSGCKIFSRRFAQSFPMKSDGFEIETEMVVWALSGKFAVQETLADYYPRPQGSQSKLSSVKDGFKIFCAICHYAWQKCKKMFFPKNFPNKYGA